MSLLDLLLYIDTQIDGWVVLGRIRWKRDLTVADRTFVFGFYCFELVTFDVIGI